ncbi:MAG: hypothetical protein PV345_03835 [Wolbachia sp.]|nr:hypothetical protein [Wolbachia sp.]
MKLKPCLLINQLERNGVTLKDLAANTQVKIGGRSKENFQDCTKPLAEALKSQIEISSQQGYETVAAVAAAPLLESMANAQQSITQEEKGWVEKEDQRKEVDNAQPTQTTCAVK